ncbi:protein yippee-like [Colletotrichum spaethianum]|uniref:Protein yippee-like n=1 Tax=Colletotrichum spaethianum TaxID=700344 RepID=A0AA37PBB3_9PEZI|nr:protein yippee-like [Colletotrichum spaethianum]GKT49062.1 protein yippee-like [Colletotrichum spaethianum]
MAPNIVVSRPTFPTYLLPSFNIPFRRRASTTSTSTSGSASTPEASQVPSLSSSPTSSTTDETVTPPNSPPLPPSYQDAITTPTTATDSLSTTTKSARTRPSRPSLARIQPDTLRCSTCSCDVAFSSQIVSKGFTGRYGRAYLVAPTPPPSAPISGGVAPPAKTNNGPAGPGSLANVRIGKCENRQLVTGWHVVADITCALCSAKLGWKYVDAKELSQKYKVGKFILEVERVVPFRSWEDVSADYYNVSEDDEESDEEGDEVKVDDRREEDDADAAEGAGKGGESEEDEVEVVFDSEDEDDLEDMFSGNWDPEVVAKRRNRRVTAARKK